MAAKRRKRGGGVARPILSFRSVSLKVIRRDGISAAGEATMPEFGGGNTRKL